jgi:hypothetical protein
MIAGNQAIADSLLSVIDTHVVTRSADTRKLSKTPLKIILIMKGVVGRTIIPGVVTTLDNIRHHRVIGQTHT